MKDTVIDMELELRGLSHIMEDNLKNKLTPGCQLLVKQLLCLGALPTCSNGGEICTGDSSVSHDIT